MEAVKKVITLEDPDKLKAVHFNVQGMQTTANENLVKNKFIEIKELEEELYELREKAREKEEYLKHLKSEFSQLTSVCTLEYETYEKEVVDYQVLLLLKNVGNDIIGHKSS